jgi:tetratricopeptide (TPR) repeat protein
MEGSLSATPENVALVEESVRLTQKVKGPEHPDTIRAWENLASIQADSGNDQRAAEARAELQKHQIRTFETQPQDMAYALRHAALMAWSGNEAESLKARAQILRVASEFTNPQDLDRAAKAASLWPRSDPASQTAALSLARRAVELGAKHQYLIYFQFAQGLAEYRSGRFAAAESTLRQVAPVSTAPEILLNTATFYRAMALFELGQKEEAQAAFDAAVAVMTPLPKDTQYPLTGGNTADNLVNWLGYREARALLTGIKEAPNPSSLARGQ